MRQIIAIAMLTVQNAIRSRIVLSLLVIILTVIILLPFSVEGDGTVPGFIQVLLSYTLGLSTFILSITTLWAGSASVSTEVSDKTIQMVVTKPVTNMQLWIGKWLGINALIMVILIVCGATTYGMLQWHLTSDLFKGEEAQRQTEQLLSARRAFSPQLPSFDQEVDERIETIKREYGEIPDMSEADARTFIQQKLRTRANTVVPGGEVTWNFGVIRTSRPETSAALEFRFSPSAIGALSVDGIWRIGTTDEPDMIVIEGSYVGRSQNSITFELDDRWNNRQCLITYRDAHPTRVSLLFDQDSPVLLIPSGSFFANYARALLITWGNLSFLAALGVTAGCLFSLPVAALVSFFCLIVLQFSGYLSSFAQVGLISPLSPSGKAASTWGEVILAVIHKAIALMVTPLHSVSPLQYISTGRLITYTMTFNALILQGLLYALILGYFSSRILRKRELALPVL